MDADKAKQYASVSCFYVGTENTWFRIDYCEEDSFTVHSEESGNEHSIYYSDVKPTNKFYRLILTE